MNDVNIKFICGDARKEIKKIEDNSINLIFTDPPYDGTEYMASLSDKEKVFFAKQFKRVLCEDGSIVLFCGFIDKWRWYNILTKLGLKFLREIIWVYKNPTGLRLVNAKKFIASHETILWFTKSDNYYFKSDIHVEKDWVEHNSFTGFIRLRGLEKLPTEKFGVTPKPLKICEMIINRLSKKGDIVLDTFAGFGTTAIASMRLGRNFIGFEIREDIYKIAKERIEKFKNTRLTDFILK